MNAAILSPQPINSANTVAERYDAVELAGHRAIQIRRSRSMRILLAFVCSVLFAALVVWGAIRVLTVVSDAVHHVTTSPTSALRTGRPDMSHFR